MTRWVTSVWMHGEADVREFIKPSRPRIAEGDLHLVFEWNDDESVLLWKEFVKAVELRKFEVDAA